jgi:hypothetical protein
MIRTIAKCPYCQCCTVEVDCERVWLAQGNDIRFNADMDKRRPCQHVVYVYVEILYWQLENGSIREQCSMKSEWWKSLVLDDDALDNGFGSLHVNKRALLAQGGEEAEWVNYLRGLIHKPVDRHNRPHLPFTIESIEITDELPGEYDIQEFSRFEGHAVFAWDAAALAASRQMDSAAARPRRPSRCRPQAW